MCSNCVQTYLIVVYVVCRYVCAIAHYRCMHALIHMHICYILVVEYRLVYLQYYIVCSVHLICH